MILDAEESAWLLQYMHEQESLPPEEMEKKRRFLERCKALAPYVKEFGHLPGWESGHDQEPPASSGGVNG